MQTCGGVSRDASFGVNLSYLRSFLQGEAQEAQQREHGRLALGRSAPRGERAHGSVSGAQRPVRRGIRAGRTDETENRSEVRPPP